MRWILIEDRFPERQTKVLGYIRDTTEEESYYVMVVGLIEMADGSYTFVDFCDTKLGNLGHNVVAWTPIPKPPKIKESRKKRVTVPFEHRRKFSSIDGYKEWLVSLFNQSGLDVKKPVRFYRGCDGEVYEGEYVE